MQQGLAPLKSNFKSNVTLSDILTEVVSSVTFMTYLLCPLLLRCALWNQQTRIWVSMFWQVIFGIFYEYLMQGVSEWNQIPIQ